VVDQGALSVKEQAMRYLKLMICPEESALMYLPTGSASPPLRSYMTSWDHNGEDCLKALGKPDKVHRLPESVVERARQTLLHVQLGEIDGRRAVRP
jgi:hypothetical protein